MVQNELFIEFWSKIPHFYRVARVLHKLSLFEGVHLAQQEADRERFFEQLTPEQDAPLREAVLEG